MRPPAAIAMIGMLTAGFAAADCARDIDGLRSLAADPGFPLQWIEIGMSDGKPLRLAIAQRAGVLHFRFDKSGEGLWAEGEGQVCARGGSLMAEFGPDRLQPGPAAPWLLRRSMLAGNRFELTRVDAGVLRVSTPGWRGRFAPADAQAGLRKD